MYKKSQFKKPAYKTGEVAELLNLNVRTIQQYDRDGKLKVHRSEGNHRLFLREDLLEFLDRNGLLYDDTEDARRDVVYARVSGHDQKKRGDLDRQAVYIIEHENHLQNPLILKEVGSGLNDQRKQLQKLLEMVCHDEVRTVYVTYKDRLTRFGYGYLETIFRCHGTDIKIMKDETENKDGQKELVEDMMSLIASFSGRLYGMRSRQRRKQIDEQNQKS